MLTAVLYYNLATKSDYFLKEHENHQSYEILMDTRSVAELWPKRLKSHFSALGSP